MDLPAHIRDYYFKNFDKLTPMRQFHFASRLASWEGSSEAIERLGELQRFLLPGPPKDILYELLGSRIGPIYENSKRRRYFEKYPNLHGINAALFRIKHLKDIYDIDLRDIFWKLVSRQEMAELNQSLRGDLEAIRWLSSFSVNHLYLSELLFGKEFMLDPKLFMDASQGFDAGDKVQLNLHIYLFTHCIIADSNYYLRYPKSERLPVYYEMLGTMDKLVKSGQAKLDAQLEYLVASRICGRPAFHETKMLEQLPKLLSRTGDYVIEPSASETDKSNSLDASEHRNVLYIMSTSEFSPHKIKI